MMEEKKNDKRYLPQRLEKRMEAMLWEPLTLVQAESGFGKTTAVRAFLERTVTDRTQIYWYTCLGEPPARAWEGICSLLEHADPKIAEYLKRIVPSSEMIGLIAQLVGRIQTETPLYCVIDNYQLAKFEAPAGLLHALSLHGCASLHIIVITQNIAVSDAAATLHPGVFEIDQNDLRFTRSDIVGWARYSCGIRLTEKGAARLYDTTDGWIAALCLTLADSDGTDQTGRPNMEELINRTFWTSFSEEERLFLCGLSALGRFTIRQAAVMSGQEVLPEEREQLIKRNFFIRRDFDNQSYSVHALLREHLNKKLDCYSLAVRKNLWIRAGEACALEEQTVDAAVVYAKAEKWNELLGLSYTGSQLMEMLLQHTELLETALERVSPEKAALYYETILRIAVKAIIRGKKTLFSKAFSMLNQLGSYNSMQRQDIRRLRGSIEFIRSFLAYNDVDSMCKHHRNARRLLGQVPVLYATTEAWTFSSPDVVYMFWSTSGGLAETLKKVKEGLPCYSGLTNGHGTGAGIAMEGQFLLLSGMDAEAERLCQTTQYAASAKNQDSICYCAEFTLSLIALLRGDTALLCSAQSASEKRVYEGYESDGHIACTLSKAFVDMLLDRLDKLPDWITNADAVRRQLSAATTGFGQIVCARYLQRQAPVVFDGLADEFLREAEEAHILMPRLYILIFKSIRYEETGQYEKAADSLRSALQIAVPDKVFFPFAAFYREISGSLEAVSGEIHSTALRTIRKMGKRLQQGITHIRASLGSEILPLTPREREVAVLAQKRMSAKEIADTLYISVATVNSTLQRIYDKLGIHSKKELLNIELR